MKRFLIALMMLLCVSAQAQFPKLNTKTVDVNKVSGNWDSFTFNFSEMTDQECKFWFTQSGTPWDVSALTLGARLSKEGTTYYDISNAAITKTSTYISYVVGLTNIPPPAQYEMEVWASDGTYGRSIAQGKVSVTKSLYANTNSYPFTTNLILITDYLTIVSAAATYLPLGTNTPELGYVPVATSTDGKTWAWGAYTNVGDMTWSSWRSVYDPLSTQLPLIFTNDYRLTNARSPTAHTQAWSTIYSTPTSVSGYGITNHLVYSNDFRLTNARSPTAHTQAASTITNAGDFITNNYAVVRTNFDARYMPQYQKATNSYGARLAIADYGEIANVRFDEELDPDSTNGSYRLRMGVLSGFTTNMIDVWLDENGLHSDWIATGATEVVIYQVLTNKIDTTAGTAAYAAIAATSTADRAYTDSKVTAATNGFTSLVYSNPALMATWAGIVAATNGFTDIVLSNANQFSSAWQGTNARVASTCSWNVIYGQPSVFDSYSGTVKRVGYNSTWYSPDSAGDVNLGTISGGGGGGSGTALSYDAATKTNSQTITAGESWTNIIGLTVTVAPSTNSAEVLLVATVNAGHDGTNYCMPMFRFTRDGTAIGVPNTTSTRTPATATMGTPDNGPTVYEGDGRFAQTVTFQWIDAPATTNSLTYAVQGMIIAGTATINQDYQSSDTATNTLAISSLLAMDLSSGGGSIGSTSLGTNDMYLAKTNDFTAMTGLSGTADQVFRANGIGGGTWSSLGDLALSNAAAYAVTITNNYGDIVYSNGSQFANSVQGTNARVASTCSWAVVYGQPTFLTNETYTGTVNAVVYNGTTYTSVSGVVTLTDTSTNWAQYVAQTNISAWTSNNLYIGSAAKPFAGAYLGESSLYLGDYHITKAKAQYWDSFTNSWVAADTVLRTNYQQLAVYGTNAARVFDIAVSNNIKNNYIVTLSNYVDGVLAYATSIANTQLPAASNACVAAAVVEANAAYYDAVAYADAGNTTTSNALVSAIGVASNNIVAMIVPGNPVGFSARNSTIQTVGVSPGALVKFDTELWDTGTTFNPATYTFTAPTNGYYQISYSVQSYLNLSLAQVCLLTLNLRVNGASITTKQEYFAVGGVSPPPTWKTGTTAESLLCYLSAGDTVNIGAYVEATSTGVIQIRYTAAGASYEMSTFSIHLIR